MHISIATYVQTELATIVWIFETDHTNTCEIPSRSILDSPQCSSWDSIKRIQYIPRLHELVQWGWMTPRRLQSSNLNFFSMLATSQIYDMAAQHKKNHETMRQAPWCSYFVTDLGSIDSSPRYCFGGPLLQGQGAVIRRERDMGWHCPDGMELDLASSSQVT